MSESVSVSFVKWQTGLIVRCFCLRKKMAKLILLNLILKRRQWRHYIRVWQKQIWSLVMNAISQSARQRAGLKREVDIMQKQPTRLSRWIIEAKARIHSRSLAVPSSRSRAWLAVNNSINVRLGSAGGSSTLDYHSVTSSGSELLVRGVKHERRSLQRSMLLGLKQYEVGW